MYQHRRSYGRGGQRPHRPHFSPRRGNRFAPKPLDSRLFVRPAIEVQPEEQVITHAFADFQMQPKLLENIKARGFQTPTPIQDKTLEPALAGKDLIGLADTGTGKTLGFVLPILNKIIQDPHQTALIMAPTRELAVQIRDEIRNLTLNLPVYSCLLIGGANIARQISDLRRRPHIYVGTPGRLKDLYERHVLKLDQTQTVVLDEMDRMLDMGFVKDITQILSYLPTTRQTLLFSATIDDRVEQIARQFMVEPLKISVKTGATAQNVEQNVVHASGKADKMAVLKDLLKQDHFSKVLIFGRTKHGVEDISKELVNSGFNADAIHGNKRQSQREAILKKFRANSINILIATDVAARGLDVKDVTHVINFDQPNTYEDYVHRIGRTGRAGKKGFAITFVE